MTMSDPERIGDILPRVLADIKLRVVKQRPKPAPVGGSLRAAMMDFFDGKMPKARPAEDAPPIQDYDPDDLKDTPF
jgi:hypothetical protein